ncbi:MAG: hypothetical protein ACM3JD_07390 [Rudaea sp.]
MADRQLEVWDLWYPDAASTGLSFARGRLDSTDVLFVHSAPEVLKVEVRNDQGEPLALGENLKLTLAEKSPMTKLTRAGSRIEREDLWPSESDLGKPVILPGGEVGILLKWQNAPDHSEWRWQVEFYNHR